MNQRYNLYNFEALFKEYLIAGNIKSLSVKNYLSDLRHFLGWLIFKLKVKSQKIEDTSIFSFLTYQLMEDYKFYLLANNIPIKTINRRLSTMRKFCSFCITQGWLKENPAKKISNINHSTSKKTSDIENSLIIKQFQQDLLKEKLDKKTIISFLEDVREFLSL